MPGYTLLAVAASIGAAQGFAAAPALTGERATPDMIKARQEVCYTIAVDGGYPPLDLRDCLSFAGTSGAVFRTQVCNYLQRSEQLRDYDFASHSDCIRDGNVK